MIRKVCSLFLCLLIAGCAALNQNNSPLEDVGEVALRVLICPLTLCTSELIFKAEEHRKAEESQRAIQQYQYRQWISTLTPEQQALEYQLEAARIQAAGQALIGLGLSGGITTSPSLQPVPRAIAPTPFVGQQSGIRSCVPQQLGASVYPDCW
jgi:hypothetical protein